MANPTQNYNGALANLKPLIAPAPISWWPPAPGWWVLGIALLLLLIGLLVWGWKYWRHYRGTLYQREALQLLARVSEIEPHKQLQEIAAILRRAAICAWGREHTSTKNWNDIINMPCNKKGKKLSPALDENSVQLLTDHLYRQETPSVAAMQNLQEQVVIWIKTLPVVKH
jgi:hypothetical protein